METHHVESCINEIDKARFWSKVNATDYCWLWTGSKDACGYGRFRLKDRNVLVHRLAYRIINGDFNKELHVLHRCDNTACVNPDHLFTGTHQDNMSDKQIKGRGKILGSLSKYQGVTFRKDTNKWRAQISHGKKHYWLGSFSTQEEAAKARDKGVIEKGLNLPLNFPIGQKMPTSAHRLEPVTGHFFTDAELEARDKERDKEVAGKSWDAALDNWDWRYDNTNPESPDKETYINQL